MAKNESKPSSLPNPSEVGSVAATPLAFVSSASPQAIWLQTGNYYLKKT